MKRPLLALLTAFALGRAAPARAVGAAAPDTVAAFRQDVAWSPDGRQLAWSEHVPSGDSGLEEWSVWVGRRNGEQRRRIAPDAEWVSFSPDGRRVAYSARRDGNWDIWTANPDGSDPRRVTQDAARDRQPAWSPAGDSIAFVSDREGGAQLWLAPARGGAPRRVTHDTLQVDCPQWSPDGRAIVFHAAGGTNIDLVHVVSLEDGTSWAASPAGAHDIYPAYLEDGRLVFTAIDSAGARRTMTMLPDGSAREPLGGPPAFFVRGSRDGKWLAGIGGAWPRSSIFIARADGSDPHAVVGADRP